MDRMAQGRRTPGTLHHQAYLHLRSRFSCTNTYQLADASEVAVVRTHTRGTMLHMCIFVQVEMCVRLGILGVLFVIRMRAKSELVHNE